MNEVQVFNFNQVDVVDSREVAKLAGKRHNDLLREKPYQSIWGR